MQLSRSQYIAQTAMIAALYAAFTLVALLFMQGLAWGPIQLRLSEAICVVALFTPAAIPGLALGCFIANLCNCLISGLGALGLLDVVFGTLATFLGAVFCWKLRRRPALAIGGFVLTNALIVPAYLPLLLQGLGYYTIPFTNLSMDGIYIGMYLFGMCFTGLGEAIVIYALGLPLSKMLKHHLFSSPKGVYSQF